MENIAVKATQALANLAEVEQRTCPDHGQYHSRKTAFADTVVWTPCRECIEAEGRKNVEEQDQKRQVALNESIMKNAAIPQRFAGRTLENYEAKLPGQKAALQVATDYADNFLESLAAGRSLIFCGSAGTGKTHLAVGIAKRAITFGKTATFTTAMDAIRSFRETYRKNSEVTERQAIARFAQPDLTIIDEVGSQLGTDAEKVTLFDLINARYERERPMIVLSNLTIAEVEQYLGTRAFDRLRENGGKAVTFSWPSYRRGAWCSWTNHSPSASSTTPKPRPSGMPA
jgi:DNA replication protein DnaC